MHRESRPPKLVKVYTEDSPQQATPLNEEHAAPPATAFREDIPPRPTPDSGEQWLAWFEVGKAVVLWITSVILLMTVPLFTALPYLVYRLATAGAAAAQALPTDTMLVLFSILGILPAHLLSLVIIWLAISEGGRRPFWETIGFEWPESLSPSATVIACGALALALFGFAQLVTYFYGQRKTDLDIIIESSMYARFATAFMATVTAPLVEEVIYRGVLYRAAEKAAGAAVAIPVVALLFAGVHVFQYRNNIAVIVVITFLSIVLTVARAVTGKLMAPFLIHLVFNGIQSVFIVLGAFIDTDPSR